MNEMAQIGKVLIVIGLVAIALGGVFVAFGNLPFFGRLPGDIMIQRKNFTFYFPLATSVIISIVITFLFWLFGRGH
jgi:hypothetical protein